MRQYRDNAQLRSVLSSLSSSFPDLATTFSIGQSVLGQDLLGVRLTAGAGGQRKLLKPMVRLIANMHGNEVTGREVLTHLATVLVKGMGRDPRITRIMETTEIHIVPTVNPDGWDRATEEECGGQDYASGRWNENKVDLNRDFPVIDKTGARIQLQTSDRNPKSLDNFWAGRQPETVAIGQWALDSPWVVAANFHDGAVVTSYPWDYYTDPEQTSGEHPTLDNDMFKGLAGVYAENHATMTNGSACLKYSWLGPVTNGAAWYPKNGTLKDFTYQYTNCLELVIELSCCKFIKNYFLPREWDNNRESLLSLLEFTNSGLKGQVLDLKGNPLAGADVSFFKGSSSESAGKNVTTSERGEFWKLLLPGAYTVQAWVNSCMFSGKVRVKVSNLTIKNIMVRKKFNCVR